MFRSFKLPDLGEGIHEREVLAVLVEVGQEIKEGDIILEIETDKAAVEIPSPFDGRVLEIMVAPGDVVNVGDAVFLINYIFHDGPSPVEVPARPVDGGMVGVEAALPPGAASGGADETAGPRALVRKGLQRIAGGATRLGGVSRD